MKEEQIASILSIPQDGSKGLLENVGLRSVNERLRLAFGDHYGLSIASEFGRYTIMNLLLPFQEKE
ncbi:hypothetical protein D3C75_1068530 [compost metagenome]